MYDIRWNNLLWYIVFAQNVSLWKKIHIRNLLISLPKSFQLTHEIRRFWSNLVESVCHPENCILLSSIVLFNALTYSSFYRAKFKNILAFSFLLLLGSDHEIFNSSGISSKWMMVHVLLINSESISSRRSSLFCWILFFIGAVKHHVLRIHVRNY